MKILYIDTTTSYLYIGLVIERKLLAEIKENLGTNLSSFALTKIDQLLKNNHLEPQDIDKIIVVNGPGSFTGIRVGVTIAKIYAYTGNKKITTITSLEAMAISSKRDTHFKIPMIDARRGYIYGAIYDKEMVPILKPQYITLESLKIASDHLIDSFNYISNQDFSGLDIEEYNPDIEKIVNTFENKEDINPHAVNPIYLKQTEAEEKQNLELI